MNGSFRLGLPAAVSVAVNGLMVLMLLYLGAGGIQQRKEAPALKIWSLAVPLGEDEGQAQRQARPETARRQPAATPAPPPPLPEPVVQMPWRAVAAATQPVAIAVGAAPAPDQPARAEPASASASAPASASAAAGQAGHPPKGANDGLNAAAPPGDSRSYAARIRSWLYAHKIYPKRARMRREEGVVRVRFVLDRHGQLLEGGIVAGSGYFALDQECQAMMHRASPYPTAPRDVPGERIEFTVPIEFVLPT